MKVVTFGEIMLRLSPPGFERLLQSPALHASFGGGEANVAVSLAHFGVESHYVTRVPDNAVGRAALRALRAEGVHVGDVLLGGPRLGIYFAEMGASQRASTVVYDRAGSSVAEIDPDSVDWERVLTGTRWLHATGITPALGPGPAAWTERALKAARDLKVTVSLDLNYRSKLWTEQAAQATLQPLAQLADVLIANEEDLKASLGADLGGTDLSRGALDVAAYQGAAREIARQYGLRQVAVTLRESLSASENGWSALLFDAAQDRLVRSRRYLVRLVDRIGGGDSFAAGLIYASLKGKPPEDALELAVAASALKQTIPGDFNHVQIDEVERLARGDASGRVRR